LVQRRNSKLMAKLQMCLRKSFRRLEKIWQHHWKLKYLLAGLSLKRMLELRQKLYRKVRTKVKV